MGAGVWFFILICIGGATCKPGAELSASKAGGDHDYAFSEPQCEEYAKEIAQAMFVQSGDRYSYKCRKVDFDPPKMDDKP
jgi:hypothetical protein